MKFADYNKTHLDVDKAAERGLVHRDYAAHFFRWSFVLKRAKMGQRVLDVGCADAPLMRVMYVNKYKPREYIGLDVRKKMLDRAGEFKVNFPVRLLQEDVCQPFDHGQFDLITCFEVIEHVPEDKLPDMLANIKGACNDDTVVMFSTPNYDGVHKAGNHIKEYTFDELKMHIQKFFIIKEIFGTFASQRDIKPHLSPAEKLVFDQLHEYYDSNALSIIFAPLHPRESRNILWICERKKDDD